MSQYSNMAPQTQVRLIPGSSLTNRAICTRGVQPVIITSSVHVCIISDGFVRLLRVAIKDKILHRKSEVCTICNEC